MHADSKASYLEVCEVHIPLPHQTTTCEHLWYSCAMLAGIHAASVAAVVLCMQLHGRRGRAASIMLATVVLVYERLPELICPTARARPRCKGLEQGHGATTVRARAFSWQSTNAYYNATHPKLISAKIHLMKSMSAWGHAAPAQPHRSIHRNTSMAPDREDAHEDTELP